VVFFWDNLGWGEVRCYGGGVLRGAPTPRIDRLASEGVRLLNFNIEAQCTPSRSALLTGPPDPLGHNSSCRSPAARTG
jgi:arylsulfatase